MTFIRLWHRRCIVSRYGDYLSVSLRLLTCQRNNCTWRLKGVRSFVRQPAVLPACCFVDRVQNGKQIVRQLKSFKVVPTKSATIWYFFLSKANSLSFNVQIIPITCSRHKRSSRHTHTHTHTLSRCWFIATVRVVIFGLVTHISPPKTKRCQINASCRLIVHKCRTSRGCPAVIVTSVK